MPSFSTYKVQSNESKCSVMTPDSKKFAYPRMSIILCWPALLVQTSSRIDNILKWVNIGKNHARKVRSGSLNVPLCAEQNDTTVVTTCGILTE